MTAKPFFPFSKAKWLLTDRQLDTAFRLCDLGRGCPKIGYVSISELESVRVVGGVLAVERGEHSEAVYPLSVYVRIVQTIGQIINNNDDVRLEQITAHQLNKI